MLYTAFIKRGWYILPDRTLQNRDEEAETYLATNATSPPITYLPTGELPFPFC